MIPKKYKTFKNLDEQISILEDKGLIISDKKYAKDVLLRENYFFINGYRHLLMQSSTDKKKFIPGTRFEELYSIFLFDRSFRNIIFKYLLVIENNLKSITSYQLSKKYGFKEYEYLKPKNFSQDSSKRRQINDLISKMKRQIRINGGQHSATQHYVQNYGYIPLWILVKVLSFGIIGELYLVLKDEDKQNIANAYGIGFKELESYLPILANYRNLCAHEDLLYNNRSQKLINDNIYHQKLNIPKDEEGIYLFGKNDLFALVIIMKQLLNNDDFKNMTLELNQVIATLAYNLNTIRVEKVLKIMGFPPNWKDIVDIRSEVDG